MSESAPRDAAAAVAAGDYAAAERFARRILRRRPRDPQALSWLGIALAALGKQADALDCFRRAAAADPQNPALHLNLGGALMQTGAFDQAHASFKHALELQPQHPETLNSLGRASAQRGHREEAVEWFQRALALRPDSAEAQDNLGDALLQLGRVDEAAACFRRAIALQPHNANFQCDLGIALALQQRWQEAIAQFQRALVLDPSFADARHNLGNALFAQSRGDEAITEYQRALALDPSFADAHYNLGLTRLFRHEFETGWQGYEKRLESTASRSTIRKAMDSVALYERLPRWRGPADSIARPVAIWAEQGIGDQVLYSTLVAELIEARVSFVYEIDRRLLGAYQRAFPAQRFVALEEPPQEALSEAKRVLLAGSLPGIFRPARESFARQPAKLLGALPGRVAHYKEALAALGPGIKVALAWRSTQKVHLAPDKSAPLERLAAMLRVEGVRFVDVQYGDTTLERRAAERVTGTRLARFDGVDHYNDLEELLAILEACDLVITTSNATAHFAGALGKRTWLLYLADRPPFHYWAHGGSYRSLWYPSVEILSAPQLTDWSLLGDYVAERLKSLTDS